MKQGAEDGVDGASQQGAGSDSSPAFRLLSRGRRPVTVREAWLKKLGLPVNIHGLFSTLAVNVQCANVQSWILDLWYTLALACL